MPDIDCIPKLLTLEEALNHEICWKETKNPHSIIPVRVTVNNDLSDIYIHEQYFGISDIKSIEVFRYGREIRYGDRKPTSEQMEFAKWQRAYEYKRIGEKKMANESNRTVYVVMKGIYSDAHICMVTMDEKHAEDMRRLLSDRWDEAYIQSYILDEYNNKSKCFYVEFEEGKPPEVHISEYQFYSFDEMPYVDEYEDPLRIYVHVIDEEHALKIAQDKYAQWKAEKDGYVL